MKVGSLFSGIGGFDLGLELAGLECAWQCEIDKDCLNLLGRHWPGVTKHGDVSDLRGTDLEPVDLIAGGFPCQDLSVAGRRAGLAGERSGLWYEFHRLLAEHRPAWVVIENVPGLLSSQGGRDFAILLRGLVELGYGPAWRILDVQHFRIPQRRRRVFIVGHLGDYRAAEVLLESEGLQGNSAPSREAREDFAGTLESRTDGGGFPGTDGAIAGHIVARPLAYSRTTDHYDESQQTYVAAPLRSRSHPNSNAPGRGGEDDENLVIGPLGGGNDGIGRRTEDDPNLIYAFTPGNSAESYGIGLSEEISPPVRGGGAGAKPTIAYGLSENQRAEILMTDVAHQLTAGSGKPGQGYPAAITQLGVRRLTPTECERLQGFPDGWTEGLSDTARYRVLGNAVCVPVAEWIGRRILERGL